MALTGKRVVLIGGTAGIGLATAQAAAAAGAQVVVVSSKSESVAKALAELPPGAQGETVDVRRAAEVEALFERIGPFDHLAYTAGEAMKPTPVVETGIDAVRQFFETRFWGAYAAIKYAVPNIRPGGSIVLSSGGASQRSGPGWAGAAAALGAMEAMTRTLAVELAPIRVNLVRPAMTDTGVWDEYPEDVREKMFRSRVAALPLGRIAVPADSARTYVHLMEQEFATGAIYVVDGGAAVV
jgi:NAD(P)-dependent dehydrogenase (short-subunit alcohol dehydrogenase family)